MWATTFRIIAKSSFIISFVLASGCSILPSEKQVLKPPLIQPDQEMKYVADEVKRGNILKKIDGMGILDPQTLEYYQFTQSIGHIVVVKVKAGDKVKKGDALIQLNSDGLDLELKQRQLDLAKKRLAYKDARGTEDADHLEIQKMEMDIAQMVLAATQQKIQNNQLMARKDGIVTFVTNLKPGDNVENYLTLLITADENDLRIALSTNGNDNMKEVKLGMEAEISYNGQSYKGKVVQTPETVPATSNGKAAEANGNTIYITLDNKLDRPQLGQQVSVIIRLASKDNALLIPVRALRTNQGRKFVQVLDGTRIQEIDVETGIESAADVEVLSGLKEGQKVVLQ